MAVPQDRNEGDIDLSVNQTGRGGRRRGMRQARAEVQIEAADAQKMMVRATTRSVRYVLWSVIACATSSVLAVLYGTFAVLWRVAH